MKGKQRCENREVKDKLGEEQGKRKKKWWQEERSRGETGEKNEHVGYTVRERVNTTLLFVHFAQDV